MSVSSCLTFRTTDKKFLKKFGETNIKIVYDQYRNRKIRLVHSHPLDHNKPTLFYVHGAPGSNDNFSKLMKDSVLNDIANWVSVDRLGYGFSGLGNPEESIQIQSESLLNVFEPFFQKTPLIILIGWSYGGPIVSKMALDKPDKIDHVIMLAPAIDPEIERFFALGKFAQWKLTRWFVPKPLRVAQDEKLQHVQELKDLENQWKDLSVPVTNIHGKKDDIVPYENIFFVAEKFPKNTTDTLSIDNVGHLFPVSQPELTSKIIVEVTKKYMDGDLTTKISRR